MAKIELDWAVDSFGDQADVLGEVTAARLGLTVRVLDEHGPAGGWPILEFRGPRAALETLRNEYADPQDHATFPIEEEDD